MRAHALEIFTAAVKAVQPQYLLPRHIQWQGDDLWLGDQCFAKGSFHKIYVAGAGKASAAMARQVEIILGDLIADGVIVTKYDHGFPLRKIRCLEAGHPVPDEKSVLAGNEIVQFLNKAGKGDIVLALISGGASSLMADYPPGSSLQEIQQLFTRLLHSGAGIREMNTVRKHISPSIKGGQLARAAYPATLVSFILSDVIGDPLEIIASGPTVADPGTFADAWSVLEKYKLERRLPGAIYEWLQQGLAGTINETPKPCDEIFTNNYNFLVGTNRIALEAAAHTASTLGYGTSILTSNLEGEASEQAATLVQRLLNTNESRPRCFLLGGETTVTLRGNGKGGRNQEFVLAALAALQRASILPEQSPVILSAGTDGTDGPTDAAGAVIDKDILAAVQKLHLDVDDYLLRNDSYHFFQKARGLVITGPTQTNVMDIVVVLLQ